MHKSRTTAAPDQLALVHSFLNTSELETGRDDLATLEGMSLWLTEQRLASPGHEFGESDRKRLVQLRSALQDLVADSGNEVIQRKAVTALNEAARRVRLGVRLHPEDGYRLMAEGVGIDRPIGDLLMSITGSMTDGHWNRLKVCANDACRRAFYDASRNRSGRWCSMAICGNRMKGRNYRQRHAGDSKAGSSTTERTVRA